MTFLRVSHECRENFYVSQTGREGFKYVKNFMPIVSSKNVARLSYDSHMTFLRVFLTCCCKLANLQVEIMATHI